MAEAFIVRRGGGGGSGGTLVVTSSGAGTVTVSNTVLGKSYSKSVTAGGSVTFKGLKTGEWTVTLSNGTQTTTKSVTINADYSVSVAYFSATISVTYPATSTCVVTNSSGQTVASDSNTDSSTKTWTATVGATGTYTVTVTATDGSGKSKSTTVSITADGQNVSVVLTYQFWLFRGSDNYAELSVGWWDSTGYVLQSGSPLGGGKWVNGAMSCIGSPNNYEGGIGTVNAVDLSGYSKLVMNGWSESNSLRTIFVTKSKNPIVGNTLASALLPDSQGNTVSIDISAINEVAYVVFTSKAGEGYSYVYNAYLE